MEDLVQIIDKTFNINIRLLHDSLDEIENELNIELLVSEENKKLVKTCVDKLTEFVEDEYRTSFDRFEQYCKVLKKENWEKIHQHRSKQKINGSESEKQQKSNQFLMNKLKPNEPMENLFKQLETEYKKNVKLRKEKKNLEKQILVFDQKFSNIPRITKICEDNKIDIEKDILDPIEKNTKPLKESIQKLVAYQTENKKRISSGLYNTRPYNISNNNNTTTATNENIGRENEEYLRNGFPLLDEKEQRVMQNVFGRPSFTTPYKNNLLM